MNTLAKINKAKYETAEEILEKIYEKLDMYQTLKRWEAVDWVEEL